MLRHIGSGLRVAQGVAHAVVEALPEGRLTKDVYLVNCAALRRWTQLEETRGVVPTVSRLLGGLFPTSLQRSQLPHEVADLIHAGGYGTTRTLFDYRSYLGPRFFDDLSALGPSGHWVDLGVGEARATRSYLGLIDEVCPDISDPFLRKAVQRQYDLVRKLIDRPLHLKAQVTGIDYRTSQEFPRITLNGKFRVLEGRYFHEIPLAEIGEADLISDLYGTFAFSHNPDVVLARALSLLKPGGRLHLFGGRHPRGFAKASSILCPGGSTISLNDWLLMIRRIEVKPDSTVGLTFALSRQRGAEVLIPRLRYLARIGMRQDKRTSKAFELV
jgi:SAM-dependent methyltransferase